MIDVHFKDIHTEFRFEMESKYLILRGDSAIGKTTFWELVRAAESDETLNLGYRQIRAITGTEGDVLLIQNSKDYIFVFDENCLLWNRSDLDVFLQRSDNYFILINREDIVGALPIGLESICTIRQSENLYTFESVYPRVNHLEKLGECIVCEDSKSGRQFLEEVLSPAKIESADGKSNFGRKMRKLRKRSYTIVYDRSGINIDYDVMLEYCKAKDIRVVSEIDWDSFEAYVLESPVYHINVESYPNKEIAAIKKMRELFSQYDKSCLPVEMLRPVYWKVKEAKDLLEKSNKENN